MRDLKRPSRSPPRCSTAGWVAGAVTLIVTAEEGTGEVRARGEAAFRVGARASTSAWARARACGHEIMSIKDTASLEGAPTNGRV